jgi:hypothetical protein
MQQQQAMINKLSNELSEEKNKNQTAQKVSSVL